MATDLAIGDREDVDLLVRDRPAGGRDAVERSGVSARHDGGGHHRVSFRDGLLEFETQIRKRVAQPSAGCEKARRAVQLTFDVIGIVFSFLVHETRGDDLLGQFHIAVFDEPE